MADGIERIARRLGAHAPAIPDPAGFDRQAAVAAIVREGERGAEVLLIKRASRPGDIWSGHMAFPGGHRDPGDADLVATAVRETHEEIGLDLGRHGRLLGAIDPLDVNPIGARSRLLVAPYVYAVQGEMPALRTNHEVASIHWGSLAAMFDGSVATRRAMPVSGGMHPFPGYQVDEEIVWGLTYQMLHRLFRVLDPHWRAPAV